MLTKFWSLFGVFCVSSSFGIVPNLDFQVNRNISLFYQTYFENLLDTEYKNLHEDLESAFAENGADEQEKEDFISDLSRMKTLKYRHKFMTPTFMSLWENACEKYDRQFDNDIEILNDRKLELKQYATEVFSKNILNFDRVFNFYDSRIDKSDKFNVFICSSQGNTKSFARAFGSNIVLKFNYAHRVADICAILEQVCFSLFREMNSNTRALLKNYFYEHKSQNSYASYIILNEVLAYAIGKLWIFEKLPEPRDSGIEDNGSDEKIAEIAKAILPIVKKYLQNNKKIDVKFVEEYIKQVDLHYPKAYQNYKITMRSISLIVENGIDYTECQKIIKTRFGTREVISEPGSFTTVFIGKNLGHPALNGLQDKLPKQDTEYMFIKLHKGKLFFVFNTDDLKKVKRGLNKLSEQPPLSGGITFNL